jgi:hypothetical protein
MNVNLATSTTLTNIRASNAISTVRLVRVAPKCRVYRAPLTLYP